MSICRNRCCSERAGTSRRRTGADAEISAGYGNRQKAVIRLPAEREGDEPLRIVYASQYYYLELSTARMLHELNITCEEDREAIEKRIGKIEKKISDRAG